MIGKTISHYKILEKLGEGGMGVVYKAQDTKLDRIVALKFLPKHLLCDAEAKTRFAHEAKAASALNHTNITTIHEIDEVEGECFICMEYVEGKSIKELIKQKTLSIEEILNIAIQIAEGLNAAHKKGIVHRDIKSDNIMLTDEGLVKIMDFGLAKLKGVSKLTKTGTTLGTTQYMSPEQVQGIEVDQHSDIFSFGVVLYEMITGQLPFKGEHQVAIIYSIINETPEPLARYKANVPEGLQRIIDKAMEKNRDERYQHVDDLRADLLKIKREHETSSVLPSTKKPQPSIAVLPFANLSADPEQEYFCDGMADEIINGLTHIEGLRVVARTSTFAFKGKHEDIREIGRKLNVETLLEGSARKAGNRLRITAQLINVADGYHLWSEKFDREMKDVFSIQDEISLAIVDKLKVKLLGEEKAKIVKRYTEDPDAYNLYLKGVYFVNKMSEEGTQRGLEYFQKSIEKDPNFALAYLGIASTYATIGNLSLLPPKQIFPKAREVLEKAREIDSTLYEAHSISAIIAFWYDWNWKNAENEFRKALAHNPGHAHAHAWYAWYLVAMGRFDEAIIEVKIAQDLDPLLPLFYAYATGIYAYSGRFEEALEQFHKAIELDPNLGLAYFHVGTAYMIQQKHREALTSFQKSIEYTTGLGWAESSLGSIYCMQGERDRATQILNELLSQKKQRYISSLLIANLYNQLGEKDKVFDWLEEAYEERDILMPLINILRLFDNLSDDPRFVTLLKNVGLEK